jgi:hypothetical protein
VIPARTPRRTNLGYDSRRVRTRLASVSFLLLASCGLWRTEKDVQRDYAKTLRPAEVTPEPAVASGPVRSFRVRAYADPEYRAQTLRWSKRIEDQVARANRLLEPRFGARLELVEVRAWERKVRAGELSGALDELLALDPGTDVDWVLGFISSLPMFSASQEQLGLATYFGRHVILRGMDSLAESQYARSALDQLSENEREDLLRARRLHKETSVLLHEWAHTLGAFHEREPASIMFPAHDRSQAGFSPVSSEVIALGLRSREHGEKRARAAWGREYRALVEKHAASAWDTETREGALRSSIAALGVDAEIAASSRAPPRDTPQPAGANEARLRCEAAVRQARHDPQTFETCRTAAAAPGAPLELVLAVPQLLVERNELRAARQAIADAEAVLAKREADSRYWARVAQLYAGIEACTDAERVASRLPASSGTRKQIFADCTRSRRWAGLHRAGGVVPIEREPEYVELVALGRRDIEDRKFDRARQRASDLGKIYPAAPGAQILLCYLQGRAQASAKGAEACAAAAAVDDEAVIPQWMLGTIAADQGRFDEAHVRLGRALELEDSRAEIWTRLAEVERRRNDSTALAALRSRYRERFGLDLR